MFKIGNSGGYAPVTVSLLAAVVLGRVLGLCGAQARLVIGFSLRRYGWRRSGEKVGVHILAILTNVVAD